MKNCKSRNSVKANLIGRPSTKAKCLPGSNAIFLYSTTSAARWGATRRSKALTRDTNSPGSKKPVMTSSAPASSAAALSALEKEDDTTIKGTLARDLWLFWGLFGPARAGTTRENWPEPQPPKRGGSSALSPGANLSPQTHSQYPEHRSNLTQGHESRPSRYRYRTQQPELPARSRSSTKH